MDYRFVRKLVKNISETEGKEILSALQKDGIEVSVKDAREYVVVSDCSMYQGGDLFVSAADEAYARQLIVKLGYDKCLCAEEESAANAQMTEVEKAEEEFYKKHKQNQILALLLIATVIVFVLVQFVI